MYIHLYIHTYLHSHSLSLSVTHTHIYSYRLCEKSRKHSQSATLCQSLKILSIADRISEESFILYSILDSYACGSLPKSNHSWSLSHEQSTLQSSTILMYFYAIFLTIQDPLREKEKKKSYFYNGKKGKKYKRKMISQRIQITAHTRHKTGRLLTRTGNFVKMECSAYFPFPRNVKFAYASDA